MEENIQNQNIINKPSIKSRFADLFKSIKPKLTQLDTKIETLVPNSKLRKVLYISLASLFGFMFFLILLGIVLSPFTTSDKSIGFTLNKPNIIAPSPVSETDMREDQRKLLEYRNLIKDLRFPESILTIPNIESKLSI